jgi:hypothetical protein
MSLSCWRQYESFWFLGYASLSLHVLLLHLVQALQQRQMNSPTQLVLLLLLSLLQALQLSQMHVCCSDLAPAVDAAVPVAGASAEPNARLLQ